MKKFSVSLITLIFMSTAALANSSGDWKFSFNEAGEPSGFVMGKNANGVVYSINLLGQAHMYNVDCNSKDDRSGKLNINGIPMPFNFSCISNDDGKKTFVMTPETEGAESYIMKQFSDKYRVQYGAWSVSAKGYRQALDQALEVMDAM